MTFFIYFECRISEQLKWTAWLFDWFSTLTGDKWSTLEHKNGNIKEYGPLNN